jgi:hypothetical protein
MDEALQSQVFDAANESLRTRALVDMLVDIARQPFQKTRFAAYHNMRSLASQPWGRTVCAVFGTGAVKVESKLPYAGHRCGIKRSVLPNTSTACWGF